MWKEWFSVIAAGAMSIGLATAVAQNAQAHGPGSHGANQQYGWHMGNSVPGCGHMGPGHRGQRHMGRHNGAGPMRHGMGHGTHGPGMGMGMGMGMGFGMMQPLRQDLSAEDVQHIMKHRLEWTGNPNIKVGKVEEKDDDTIIAEIVTQDGSLVDQLQVNRHTGFVQPVR